MAADVAKARARRRRWAAAHRDYQTEWQRTHAARHNELSRESRQRYPEKNRARSMLHYHLKEGSIQRQPCEICGDMNTQAHHDDYSKPLDVRWLCVTHHAEHHTNYER